MNHLNNSFVQPVFPEFDNIFYESPNCDFNVLNECTFLKDTFINLNKLLKSEFHKYIFFIFSFGWNQDYLPESITYKTEKRKVLVYISDESGNVPYYLSQYYFSIFKIHLQSKNFTVNNIFNFSLGCVKDVPKLPLIDIKKRKYTVFFCGNLNKTRLDFFYSLLFGKNPNKIIQKTFELLLKIKYTKKILTLIKFDRKFPDSYIRFTTGFKQGISPAEYGRIIADSMIVLCPKGLVFSECFRHYEAMRAGCIIISEKLPPTYFYNNSPIIQIDNWKDGLDIASKLLNNSTEIEQRSKLMIDWWESHCSEKATAQYMVDCIKSLE